MATESSGSTNLFSGMADGAGEVRQSNGLSGANFSYTARNYCCFTHTSRGGKGSQDSVQ